MTADASFRVTTAWASFAIVDLVSGVQLQHGFMTEETKEDFSLAPSLLQDRWEEEGEFEGGATAVARQGGAASALSGVGQFKFDFWQVEVPASPAFFPSVLGAEGAAQRLASPYLIVVSGDKGNRGLKLTSSGRRCLVSRG